MTISQKEINDKKVKKKRHRIYFPVFRTESENKNKNRLYMYRG